MKSKEFIRDHKTLSTNQLSGKIKDTKADLIKLRQDQVLGKLKKTTDIRVQRKNLARLMTILDQKITEDLVKKQ